MNPYLVAMGGPTAGQRIELRDGESSLGRDAGNTILISDQTVSRRHALITVTSGSATIQDVGSSAGTFINEQRISSPVILKVGDTIRVGATTFQYVPGASVSPMGVTGTMPSRSGRKREVGSSEARNLPPATPMAAVPNQNPGCMPDLSGIMKDIEGCMPAFLRFFIILVIILVVVGIIGGVIALVGIAGSAGAVTGAAGAAGGAASGSGSPGGAGPAAGGGQDQQQQQKQPPTQPANGAIKIISVRTAYLPREGYISPIPIALIRWQNLGQSPVVEIFANVTSYDKAGTVIGLQKGIRIYTGPAVPANSQHEDDEKKEGVQLSSDPTKQQSLDHASVEPTEIRVQQAQPDGTDPTE